MNSVISALGVFFLYAVMAAFAQNAVLARGMGVSRLVQLVGDDDTSSLLFSLELCVICLMNALLAWLLVRWVEPFAWHTLVRPLGYVACTCISCGLLWLVLTYAQKMPRRMQLRDMLPNAGFNSCVAGTLLVTTTQSYTLAQSFGYALGSGVGYLLAVALVAEARRRLQGSEVPQAFKGLPIVLVYIGILALAIYGFTGHAIAI
ncbi:MAG: NADH:ubiquinone oxidoreductase, subunit RnfA [Faecalibacterium sp.]|jgi:Na+-translocating ferredoxin:NAD+ oxidoreductase RnfA subunit|nr:NADH:ubiquinone oxidoreductase, subunit RnfA [Faecalibacterium sp.]